MQRFPSRVLYSRVLGSSMGFFGGPTDRVGDSFNFFVCPLSKLRVSDAYLRVREKHGDGTVRSTYLLLAKCEVHTASYGPSFFLPFMAQARKRAGHENVEGKIEDP